MDGVHDLGGKHGHGAVTLDTDGHVQLNQWEARMWALAQCTDSPETTIDWWRHVVECLEPATYLTIPYFEKWALTYMTTFITEGAYTIEEILAGHTSRRTGEPEITALEEVICSDRDNGYSFESNIEAVPAFLVGQAVETVKTGKEGHTRLPAYVRGRKGKVLAHRGGHPLPDLNAKGIEKIEHLYTVVFTAEEVWGNEASSSDTIRVDLWETYLVPA